MGKGERGRRWGAPRGLGMREILCVHRGFPRKCSLHKEKGYLLQECDTATDVGFCALCTPLLLVLRDNFYSRLPGRMALDSSFINYNTFHVPFIVMYATRLHINKYGPFSGNTSLQPSQPILVRPVCTR